jgi:hypothetical protein
MPSVGARRAIFSLPPVPSTTPVYMGTSTTTTDEATSTFTGVNIGTPHPRRMVILANYHGVAAAHSSTVNGQGFCEAQGLGSQEFSMAAFRIPDGDTATIVITATASLRKAVSVFVIYPERHLSLDRASATANTTTDANAPDIKCQSGGSIIYSGGQHATLGTFTTTWNGSDAVTESVDAQLEAAGSYTAGFIPITTSADLNDVNMAESTSGTKRLVVMSHGPPCCR